MTAGVISFKLCPLDFDCEHCDFDEAMRSQVKSKRSRTRVRRHKLEALVSSQGLPDTSFDSRKSIFFTFSAGEVDEQLYLHPCHLWIRRIDETRWRLGMGRLLAYVLPPPVRFELNGQKKDVIQNQLLGKVHTRAGTIPLTAPLSGRLVKTNSTLEQCPELAQQDPHGDGWLTEMEWSEDHSELEKMHAGPSAKRFLEEEAQHLNFLLKHRGMGVSEVGETLPDGGVNVKYLHQILPSQVCLGLASELIVSGKQAW
jgi:glycine cleavage system H protein